jgi:rhodanese-related sulfurtransferase
MVVRALAIIGFALLVGLVDSYFRPIQVSLQGSSSDPTITPELKSTHVAPLTPEEEKDPRAALAKMGGDPFIKVDEAKQLYDLGVIFFDARVEEEFKLGRVKGAILADPTDAKIVAAKEVPEFLRDEKKFSRKFPVVVYCNGGDCDSSQLVAIQMRKFGFAIVKVFEEGYPIWLKKGYPVETN